MANLDGVPCRTHPGCLVIFRSGSTTRNGRKIRPRKGKVFPIHLRSGRKKVSPLL